MVQIFQVLFIILKETSLTKCRIGSAGRHRRLLKESEKGFTGRILNASGFLYLDAFW